MGSSDSASDILRDVVMGRVMDDGSWTEVGRFSDGNVTFHGEEMPEEFKTKHLNLWDEVSFTAELEPTIAKRFADEIYKEIITPFLLQMRDRLSNTEEIYICCVNPDDHNAIEFIKSAYGIMQSRILNDVVYTKAVEPGKICLVPVSRVHATLLCSLLGIKANTTALDELATKAQQKPPVRDISWIRKQMKHCKNPMERRQLERELNAAFKEKKRRRNESTG